MNVDLRVTCAVTVTTPPEKSLDTYPAKRKRKSVARLLRQVVIVPEAEPGPGERLNRATV